MSRPAIFRAKVNDQGQLMPAEVGRWAGVLSKLKGQTVEVELRTEPKTHTRSQRGWYRASIVPEVAAFLSEAKGYVISKDQSHDLLKRVFIGTVEFEVNGVIETVAISTKTLDPAAFSDYCTAILAHFAGLGLIIATPEDFWTRKPSEVA
jgi:hypothetical protein